MIEIAQEDSVALQQQYALVTSPLVSVIQAGASNKKQQAPFFAR